MRAIHIANAKKRDAEVGLEALAKKTGVRFVLPDGGQQRNVKILRSVTGLETLTQACGGLRELGEAIIAGDPEVDREQVGKFLRKTHKLYLNHAGQVAYRVNLLQVVRNPDGTEKERRDLMKAQANVTAEIPIQWSGRKFPKDAAIRRFVFTRQYQIRHTNGLSYDFLYAMAKELQEAGALMFVGAGKKGSEPIVITTGGEPYRGFLEGRVDGDRYCLILHLTNLELKPLVREQE